MLNSNAFNHIAESRITHKHELTWRTQVYLLAATLRPETMYGQTNCWVLPHDKEGADVWYGCYRTHVANEVSAN
jgi:hypothetical protein